MEKKPAPEAVTVRFDFEVVNIDELLHEQHKPQKNVRIVGEVSRSLCAGQGPATHISRSLLNAATEDLFEMPAERIPSANAIRCAKYRAKKKEELDDCPIAALRVLKRSYYTKWIRGIGDDPFYCMYGNTDQIILYKVYKKKNALTSISCDATGSVVRKIVHEDGEKSEPIYLYSFVISDHFQIPIWSMISGAHHLSFVLYWFFDFIRLYGDAPKEFKSDMSQVLLNAAAIAFASCANISEYADWLFNMAKNRNDSNISSFLPKCFIRIDVNHLVKNITSCDELKSKSAEHKQFLVRATCLLIPCTSLEKARKILYSILVVAKSKVKDSVFNNHKKYLDDLVSGASAIDITSPGAEQFHNKNDDVTADSSFAESGPIQDWLDELNDETSNEINENTDGENATKNEWENMGFVQYLLRLSKSIVLWTGICSSFFNAPKTASSANVESYFKNVKQTLHSIIPCRADEFVCAHIDMMEGMSKEASLTYIDFIDAAGGLQSLLNDHSTQYDSEGVNEEPESRARDDLTADSASNQAATKSRAVKSKEIPIQSEGMSGSDLTTDSMASDCVACQNGDEPSGAHKCIKCAKSVHILDGCSISCGDDEGYGEGRICLSCVRAPKPAPSQASTRSLPPTKITAEQLNEKEVWQRKKQSNNSYLRPVPNWNLDRRVQSKPKINMFLNGSLSTTTHKVGTSKVAVRNTCAFDSICQLFAASHAYFVHHRMYMEGLLDTVEIFDIAISLAKCTNMRTLNKKRAVLITKLNQVPETEEDEEETELRAAFADEFKFDVNKLASKLLLGAFTLIEEAKCNCSYFFGPKRWPIISVGKSLQNDFGNFVEAITENFLEPVCPDCKNPLQIEQQFGNYMLMEVPHERYSRLKDVIKIIKLGENNFSLCGVIVFEPSASENSSGHYKACIAAQTSWIEYDDMKNQSTTIASNASVMIVSMLYIKLPD
ncbi:uncharacterized protein LOC129570987 [Sitodiplosis mosellana]|uniref:uncharacterized protein LOC129570987 n=1 Tax=Sitodiplosis mosellana TaxID=263140 RepID=UPI0024448F6B|nr:uncharacterized protein LOC129570987 [Sitodiplosis mosellana]